MRQSLVNSWVRLGSGVSDYRSEISDFRFGISDLQSEICNLKSVISNSRPDRVENLGEKPPEKAGHEARVRVPWNGRRRVPEPR